jgi:hypothetical protein
MRSQCLCPNRNRSIVTLTVMGRFTAVLFHSIFGTMNGKALWARKILHCDHLQQPICRLEQHFGLSNSASLIK